MTSTWLPIWLAWGWVAVFAGILVVHLWHLLVLVGRERLWHGVHVLMAAALVAMFLPSGATRLPVAGIVAALLAVAVAIGALLARARPRSPAGAVVVRLDLDLAAMSYMAAMMTARSAPVTVALTVWFAAQATGWVSGRLCRVLADNGLCVNAAVAAVGVPGPGAHLGLGTESGTVGKDKGRRRLPPVLSAHPEGGAHERVLGVSLGLLAIGMAYMLIVMQWTMTMAPAAAPPSAPGGMPAMPGM